jgi:hypothetical protein
VVYFDIFATDPDVRGAVGSFHLAFVIRRSIHLLQGAVFQYM